ncbi:phosphatidylglycerophosphatase A family protein [Pollutimonas thiosulfatoxidans]|uniref:Phosphatidylglycerophosphatase A n=1 Tax=Pollutimonas thiosulfatoxidans TaxID=2028345 RepID=A0A410GCY1_9BURK|nr:phosphatidylglycerophosphatase A [Pollutimonas thiosulfatoxidans]MBF6616846.1 phosphatidylglycerophosphatase A [Candidimonas sp.]NYT43896.1 phosphatidylglycerophosphatase A [Alcaligenaceae bacterium]QAA94153.1 phosphatidylglycerophosphatase A [Pollutimonas thiosulfatoxidans]
MPVTDPLSDTPHAFKPTAAWVFGSLPRVISFGFGSGLIRPAPGTWGTLLGWLLWVVGVSRLPDPAIAAVLVLAFALGCWTCHRVGREMGKADDGGMVWDEVVAFWLVLWLTPDTWIAQLVAFVVFRFFDIAKPPPISFFDKHFKNGFGVMWDDIVAAAYSLLLLAVLVRLEVFP